MMNPRKRRVDDGPVPVLAVDLTPKPFALGMKPAPSADETQEAHERRWAYIQDQGWSLTEDGLVLDASDPRWSKTDRILIEYAEGIPFEEGVRAAYRRQKMLEAQELAREQRGERGAR